MTIEFKRGDRVRVTCSYGRALPGDEGEILKGAGWPYSKVKVKLDRTSDTTWIRPEYLSIIDGATKAKSGFHRWDKVVCTTAPPHYTRVQLGWRGRITSFSRHYGTTLINVRFDNGHTGTYRPENFTKETDMDKTMVNEFGEKLDYYGIVKVGRQEDGSFTFLNTYGVPNPLSKKEIQEHLDGLLDRHPDGEFMVFRGERVVRRAKPAVEVERL
jgi:hypothetical protein